METIRLLFKQIENRLKRFRGVHTDGWLSTDIAFGDAEILEHSFN